MIDEQKLASVKGKIKGEVELNVLESFSEDELRKLMIEVQTLLPPNTLDSLNLERELVEQFQKVKCLQDSITNDKSVLTNQKAQVCNSIVAALAKLVQMQEDLRRQETLKIMESCLIEVVKTLPEEAKVAFFAEYERLAEKAGLS